MKLIAYFVINLFLRTVQNAIVCILVGELHSMNMTQLSAIIAHNSRIMIDYALSLRHSECVLVESVLTHPHAVEHRNFLVSD